MHNVCTGARFAANEVSTVRFDPIPPSIIERAISEGDIFGSAGAFAIENPLFKPYVAKIEGTGESIQGLPLDLLRSLLKRASAPAVPAYPSAQRSPSLPLIASATRSMGIRVRPMKPGDEGAAHELFAIGMLDTIQHGLHAELLRPVPERIALVCALVAVAASLGPWLHVAGTPLLGALAGLAMTSLAFACVFFLASLRMARGYVHKSLDEDMRSPCTHYLTPHGSCVWVAVDGTGKLAGMVAVEPPSNQDSGWAWRAGDTELRRMSVAPWARRKVVGGALFSELQRFCEQAGYERIVLATSTLQGVAHSYLCPRWGFVPQHARAVFGEVIVTYFALPLRTSGEGPRETATSSTRESPAIP